MYLRVYKKEEIRIATTFKICANRSFHTLFQYSIAKVRFVYDKLWLGKIKHRKKFPDIHRSVGMLNSRNGLSLCE